MTDFRNRNQTSMNYQEYVKIHEEPPKMLIRPIKKDFNFESLDLDLGVDNQKQNENFRLPSHSMPQKISNRFTLDQKPKNSNDKNDNNQIVEDSEEEGNVDVDPEDEEHRISLIKQSNTFKQKEVIDKYGSFKEINQNPTQVFGSIFGHITRKRNSTLKKQQNQV